MGITIVMEHVRTADTTYRMDNKVLVNIDILKHTWNSIVF